MNSIRLVLISGISGSGKTTALRAFEDIGFFCINHLPVPLIAHFLDLLRCRAQGREVDFPQGIVLPDISSEAGAVRPGHYALMLDCRDEKLITPLLAAINEIRVAGIDVTLLFIDCNDDVVVRRFRETRRPHPLLASNSFSKSIVDALEKERKMLLGFREAAEVVIDTTTFNPHELRRVIEDTFGVSSTLNVRLVSFGFRYGVPYDTDLVFDVRFLPNPHFIENLKPQTGLDDAVKLFVSNNGETQEFLGKLKDMLNFLLPKYQREGKHYLTIGIGCTGGKHRSVAICESLGETLRSSANIAVATQHRDISR